MINYSSVFLLQEWDKWISLFYTISLLKCVTELHGGMILSVRHVRQPRESESSRSKYKREVLRRRADVDSILLLSLICKRDEHHLGVRSQATIAILLQHIYGIVYTIYTTAGLPLSVSLVCLPL